VSLLCAREWAEQTQLFYWRRISQGEIRKITAAEKRGRGGNFYPLLAGLSPKIPFPACGRQASRPARASVLCRVKRGNQFRSK